MGSIKCKLDGQLPLADKLSEGVHLPLISPPIAKGVNKILNLLWGKKHLLVLIVLVVVGLMGLVRGGLDLLGVGPL